MKKPYNVVFFDVNCSFCVACAEWLASKDKNKQIYFSPLQGKSIKSLLPHQPSSFEKGSAMIFLEQSLNEKRVFVSGKAAFRVLKHIKGGFYLFWVLFFLPQKFLDVAYKFIAARRYMFCELNKKISQIPKDRLLP